VARQACTLLFPPKQPVRLFFDLVRCYACQLSCCSIRDRGEILKQALINMLTMQHNMNTHFEWYRAVWIECGELIDHYGYKWWKKQEHDVEQVKLEIIDIWHFGMSALFREGKSIAELADEINAELEAHQPSDLGVREATEAVALHSLQTRSFSPAHFRDLMLAADMDFDELYAAYVGKNVLNFFRQDHGYKEGTYVKTWQGREDNEHLAELVSLLDHGAEDFADQVYQALEGRYREVAQAS
jgi:hypothetical protein